MAADDKGLKQLDRNTWQVRVKGTEGRTGRMAERKATVIGTKQEARARRDSLRAELKSSRAAPAKVRLSEYAASWLEARASRLKPSVLSKYGGDLQKVIPLIGDIFVDALTPSDIIGYLAVRAATTNRRGRAPAGNTLLNELRLLRTIAKDSVADGFATIDWCTRVPAPKVARYTLDNPNLLTAPQLQTLMMAITESRRGVVALLVTTGLRWGEANALTWADVDDAQRQVTVRRSNWRGILGTPKTEGSERVVPLLPIVRHYLGDRGAPDALLFPNRKGQLYRSSPLIQTLERAIKKTGLPKVTVHGLRRSFNNIGRQVTSGTILRRMTGHTTEEMTDHYSVVSMDEATVASQAVGALIDLPVSLGVPEVYHPTREDFQPPPKRLES